MNAGPVTFTAYFRHTPSRQLRPRPGHRKRLKAPIFVDAGPATTISVLGRGAARTEIRVGRDGGGEAHGSAVRLAPCPPDATVAGRRVGSPTPFLGGWRIARPGCVRIAVLPEGAAEPIRKRLPFGKGSCRR